jgi:chaperonin GroES
MTLRPLDDRVLGRRLKAPKRAAVGIIVPDNAREKPQGGEIVSVGSGTRGEDGTIIAPDVEAVAASCSANGPPLSSRWAAKTPLS